jgi:hypothetical protein
LGNDFEQVFSRDIFHYNVNEEVIFVSAEVLDNVRVVDFLQGLDFFKDVLDT